MTDTHPRERVRRRRRSTGSSSGSLNTTSESRGVDISDDPEVEDLNDTVLSIAQEGQQPRPPTIDSEEEVAFTPRNRMKDVRTRGGKYEREYRLQLLHRMLMRRVPLDEIARELDVSTRTIMNDRQELYRRLREEAKKLDINAMIGDTMGFFAEVQGMALRAASVKKFPMNVRLAAMRTALSSRNDQHKFLQASGVFDVLRYRMSENDSKGDIDKLMDLTASLLDQDDESEHHMSEIKSEFPELEQFSLEDEEEVEVRLF
jgi:hypothetical protein